MWQVLVGKVIGKLVDKIPNKARREEMKHELDSLKATGEFEEVMRDKDIESEFMQVMAVQIKGVTKIAIQDSKSSNPLASSWRPLACMGITLCVMNHYLIVPWLTWAQAIWWPDTPAVPKIEDIEQLLYLVGGVLGVFGVGRSFEKWKGVTGR